MIIDLMSPLITPDGVGTLCTLNHRDVLGIDLKFSKLSFHYAYQENPNIYVIAVGQQKKKRSIAVTNEIELYREDGEVHPSGLIVGDKIRSLSIKCIYCGEYYYPSRMIQEGCSKSCLKTNIKKVRILNRANLDDIREDWHEISEIKTDFDIKYCQVAMMEKDCDSKSVYLNGILIKGW